MGDSAKPRLRGFIRPVGTASAVTYWVRRLAALAVVALVALVPMWVTTDRGAAGAPAFPPGPVTTTVTPAQSSPVTTVTVPSPTSTRHPAASNPGRSHPGGHASSPARTATQPPISGSPESAPPPSRSGHASTVAGLSAASLDLPAGFGGRGVGWAVNAPADSR